MRKLLSLFLLGFSVLAGEYQYNRGRIIRNSVVFSEDFSRVAFVVYAGENQQVVVNNRVIGSFLGVGFGSLHFVSDEVVFIARDKKGWSLYKNGKRGKIYTLVVPESLVISPEGNVAFVGKMVCEF